MGSRLFWRGLLVGALAGALLATSAAVLAPKRMTLWASTASTVDNLAGRITALRGRIERAPADWLAWAELGIGYLERARLTGNPAWYAAAEGALSRSLAVHPERNAQATAGLGLLAAARHDFTKALGYGRAAAAIERSSALAATVVADSLVGLGRYDDAWRAIDELVNRKPDAASYARAGYAWQLRGDMARAKSAMEQALARAGGPLDTAFALEGLSMLAWETGDLDAAWQYMSDGLDRAPDSVPLLATRARLSAARGQVGAAIGDWEQVLASQPLPAYAAEYGDLLASAGDDAGAKRQWDVARATAGLFEAYGVDMSAEIAIMEAEHGSVGIGVAAARAGFGARPTVFAADALAWSLHLAGQHVDALRYAERALSLGTRNAAFLFHRAMIRLALGDRSGARADLRAALATNPAFSTRWAPVARSTLARL